MPDSKPPMAPLAEASAAPRPAAIDPRWLRWVALAVAVVVLDQVTKHAILATFRVGEELRLTSFASLVLAYNSGAAFSFLAGADGWQRWLFTVVAIAASVFIVVLLRKGGSVVASLALALILGGAIGNVIDRVTIGQVVDFMLVHYAGWYFPAFNVADSAITIGAILLIYDSFRPGRREAKAG